MGPKARESFTGLGGSSHGKLSREFRLPLAMVAEGLTSPPPSH